MKKAILIFSLILAFVYSIANSQWILQGSGTNSWLYGVHFADDNYTGCAVGSSGTIVLTTNSGAKWSVQIVGENNFRGVRFINAMTGWIVGSGGTILMTYNRGENWIYQNSGTVQNLQSVFFINSLTGWVVGDTGTVMKTTNRGVSWVFQSVESTDNLNSIFFINGYTGWIAANGGIYKTTNSGINWIQKSVSGNNSFLSIHFVNHVTGWVSGRVYTLKKSTDGGETWITISPGAKDYRDSPPAQFTSVHFMNVNTGWHTISHAFGGSIHKTTDGGQSWFGVYGTTRDRRLEAMCIRNSNYGWAVGENGTILHSVIGGVDSSRYFPLQVGNAFYYVVVKDSPGDPDSSYIISRITHSKDFNNKTYYHCTNFLGYLYNDLYLRYDTITGNLVRYDSLNLNCNYELALYNLGANIGDSSGTSCLSGDNFKCADIEEVILFDTVFREKDFYYYYHHWTGNVRERKTEFGMGIGVFYNFSIAYNGHSFRSTTCKMLGAIVNGIVYGDTTHGFRDFSVESFINFPEIFLKDTTYQIVASVNNNGDYDETDVPVKLLINDVVVEQQLLSIPFRGFNEVEFLWAPPDTGIYKIAVASVLDSDQVRYNDTLQKNVTVVPVINDFSADPFLDFPFLFMKDSTYHIKAVIKNEGNVDENNVPIRFLINGSQVGYYLLNIPIEEVDSVDFIWTPHATGDYNVAIACALPNDYNRTNDTVKADISVYSSPPLSIFCDDFSGGIDNWIITHDSGACFWQTYSPPYPNAYTLPETSSGAVLAADANVCGYGNTLLSDATIIENVDCSVYESVYLEFDNDWNGVNNYDYAIVDVSYDGGINWGTINSWGKNDVRNTRENYYLPSADGNPNVRVRFVTRQGGGHDWWAIDNVCIKGFPLTGLTQNSEIPSKYALMQNYPNPFNPTTKIRFDLPKSTQAKLIIYDILGREIITLINEKLNAGSYEVEWSAGSYPSGVYFYRLITKDFSQTKRMMLIK